MTALSPRRRLWIALFLAAGVSVAGVGALTWWHGIDVGAVMSMGHAMLNFNLISIGGVAVTPAALLTAGAIALLARQASHVLQRGVARAAQVRGLDPKEGGVAVAQRLLHYLVLAVGLGVALQTVGVDLGGLFAAGAVFAVGFGFAMQNIAQNFVSGVILLTERAIKPGDVVVVSGATVRVREMGIRATIARTRDDEDLIIPNSSLVQSTVTNQTLEDRMVRVRAPVGVAYESDLVKVFEALGKAADRMAWKLDERDPVVQLNAFGSSSVDFEVSVWIPDPWQLPARRSLLLMAVWEELKAAGITIAFPQVDVHVDPAVEAWFTEGARRVAQH